MTDALEVLLGHPGGPIWANRDAGAWSLPKGEYPPSGDAFTAAQREFQEEVGAPAPTADYRELGTVRLSSGKLVTAWAAEADFDASSAVSNTFEMEWPPRTGRRQSFPELDRVEWFPLAVARTKLARGQQPFLDRLLDLVAGGAGH